MKLLSCIALCLLSCSLLAGQASTPDSLGLPGDNLNLHAVLDLFKQSKNVEDFEKRLNDPDTKINNLDLNNDGQVDYIRVVDYGKDDLHSLVLQVPVNKTESQDVAVIEVEKTRHSAAHIQIVGDEALYGKDYIVQPQSDNTENLSNTQSQAPANSSNTNNNTVVNVNVWGWPCVNYMYGPAYSFWVSPWYWGYYPSWWQPWRPYSYFAYTQWYFYHPPVLFCQRVYVNSIPLAQTVYYPHKTSSVYVQKNITVNNNINNAGSPKSNGIKANGMMKQQGGSVQQKPAQHFNVNKSSEGNPVQSQPQQQQNLSKPDNAKSQRAAMRQQERENKPAMQPANKPMQQREGGVNRNGGERMNRPVMRGGGGGGRRR